MLQKGAPASEVKLFIPNLGGSQVATSANIVSDEDQAPRQNGCLNDTRPLLQLRSLRSNCIRYLYNTIISKINFGGICKFKEKVKLESVHATDFHFWYMAL